MTSLNINSAVKEHSNTLSDTKPRFRLLINAIDCYKSVINYNKITTEQWEFSTKTFFPSKLCYSMCVKQYILWQTHTNVLF